MPKLKNRSLQKTNLTTSIYKALYVKSCPGLFVFGLSCLFIPLSYAQEVISDTQKQSNAIVQAQPLNADDLNQNDHIVIDAQENANSVAVDTTVLDTAIQQFNDEAVYQLKDSDIPVVDQSLANEIYQIAEEAQQEAKVSESIIPPVNQLISEQNKNIETEALTQVQDTVSVDALVQEIQGQQLDLPEFQESQGMIEPINEQQAQVKKRGFFSRLFRRNDMELQENFKPLPKIQTTVTGDNGLLANNIKAKLSTFTVEAFEDFNAALPQLRNMTVQAAEAVGYYQAEFQFQKQDDDDLLITVVPNQPVKVESQEIEFTGEGANRPVFQVIKIVPDLNIGDQFNHELYETTKLRINKAASDSGYFDSYWQIHDAKVTLPDNTVDINLLYETGERYQLDEVEFRMMDPTKPFPLRESVLKQLAPFKEGDDYTSWRVNTLSNNLINSRYFNFALVNEYRPDEIEKKTYLPNEPINNTNEENAGNIESASATINQNVVNEELFAGTEVQEDTQAKEKVAESSSGFFISQSESDQLKATAREEKKVPVIVFLNADQPNNLETGFGYGTDTGFRLRAQYRRAIVNDRGHSFDSNIELSQKRQAIDGRYMIPYKHPLNDYFSVIGGYEREVRDSIGQGVELDIESGVMGLERVIKRPLGQWQHTLGVRYRLDRITSNGVADQNDIPDAFKVISSDPEQESLLFGYEISRTLQRNDANPADRTNPTHGFRQFYRIDVGSESLLTETNMAIINAGWRFIYSLGENADHQFVGRGDLGYIVTDNFDRVPYNLRYFAGGDQSLRGYDYKSLGPRVDDLLIGGQSLAVGSLEYNYQFKEKWRAAVFADVGNAYDEKYSNETKYGIGLGIRWASPVGPIRLDVAAGVSEDSIPIRLHFFIGPAL